MSDVAVAVETPVAPAAPTPAAPVAPVAPTPVAEAPKVLSKREARQQARAAGRQVTEAMAAPAPTPTPEPAAPTAAAPAVDPTVPAEPAAPEPTIDARGRAHAPAGTPEAGQFLPSGEAPDAPAEPTPEPVAPEAPKGVRVALDKHRDHPALQGVKVDALTVGSEDEAKLVQSLINGTYVRRNENETLKAQLREREEAILELQRKVARTEATQVATEKWQQTPEYQKAVERYEAIRDTVGQEEASAYWKGIQGDLRALVDSEYSQRETAILAEQQARDGQRWEAETRLFVDDRVPEKIRQLPDFGRWYAEELDTFEIKIERGHYPDLQRLPVSERSQAMRQAFLAQLNARLNGESSVRTLAKQMLEARRIEDQNARARAAQDTKARAEAERKQVAQGAVEQFKKDAADKRAASPPHPMGTLAASARPSPNGTAAPEPEDLSKLTHVDLKKRARLAARASAARHFGP